MSRRKTKPEEIRKPENYFAKYIAMENRKEAVETAVYYQKNVSLEQMLTGGDEGVGKVIRSCFAFNKDHSEFEIALSELHFFGWIDMVENSDLHSCLKTLSNKQLTLLTLRFHVCKSQAETARILSVTQQAVSKLEKNTIKEIKRFLQEGCKKP